MPHSVRARPPVRRDRSRRRSVMLRGLAVLSLVSLLAAGCVAPKEQRTLPERGASPSGGATTVPADLDAFYGQDLSWSDCEGYQCATVQAPLDWDAPESGSIQLAVKRSPATGSPDQRIGSLLINPGGPGGSGLDFVDYAVSSVMGDGVLAAYDIVGFDPRGVGQSSAVTCGDDAVIDEFFTADVPIESQADVEAARERERAFGQACLESSGALLGTVDTVSAARDLDLLRAVLGDAQLYYAGFSYGTFLGATYADLYPQNVGRMLLDGALDPSMSNDDLVIGQAIGFENALRAYVEYCQAERSCPLSGSVDEGMRQVAELVDRAQASPLDAGDGNTVNGTMAYYGVVVTLYDDASWGYLTMALDEALRRNGGAALLELADIYLDRTPDGTYTTNSMEAFTAINCLDYPMEVRDYDELVAFADQVQAQAPTFGKDFAMAIGCETWPFTATGERRPITAPGAAPILVVGTTGDPATPYDWSVALADELESGHLLTWQGEGHTAYGRSGACVSDAVETYLLDGTPPAEGTVC